jgi:DNA-binding transcriptional LysR family regulator
MNSLNLEQLRTFLAVVRLGGIRKAANGMHITQPAVTARIKALEATLAAELFDRSSAGMKLTKRGELLLTYAEKFEHLSEMVARDVIHPDGMEGRLRLGVSETIAQCWLPELIARCHRRYPNLEIEFDVDISTNLRASLLGHSLDLAVLLGPISEQSIDNIPLPGFELTWYVAADAPELDDPADYLTRPVLTYARNTRPYRELKDMLFERVGPEVQIFPSSSLSACFRLVEAGLGVAALPKALGRAFLEAGTIRSFDPGWAPSPLQFTASYRGEPTSHMVQTAARLAREVALDYQADQKS